MHGRKICPLKISQLVEDDHLLLMHIFSGMGLSQTILGTKIRKLIKNLVYFGLHQFKGFT